MRLERGYRGLPIVLAALSIVGLGISVYLASSHYGKKPIECGGLGECDYVNSSEYASVAGVPVSVLGVALYAALTLSAVLWSRAPTDERRLALYWGLALSGAGYAAYLTYLELAVLHAICVWCVASAIVLAASLLIATAALFLVPEAPSQAQGPPFRYRKG